MTFCVPTRENKQICEEGGGKFKASFIPAPMWYLYVQLCLSLSMMDPNVFYEQGRIYLKCLAAWEGYPFQLILRLRLGESEVGWSNEPYFSGSAACDGCPKPRALGGSFRRH